MEEVNLDNVLKDVKIEDIQKRIEELQKLNLETQDFNELKNLVLPLIQCGLNTVIFPRGMRIHRGRCIDVDKEYLKHSSQLSYPPTNNLLRYNRASSGKYQIFYGSASKVYGNNELGHIAVNFELSQIHDESFPNEFEYIGLGRWYSTDDFRVAVLGLDSKIAENNDDAVKLKEFQTTLLNDLPERFKVIQLVSNFLSHEFSKKVKFEYEYKITAAYGEVLFEMGFPAIMFPSVKTDGRVFNIAIMKKHVDNNLKCEVAAITRSRKIRGEVFGDYLLVSETVNEDGTFNWNDPPASSQISKSDLARIEQEIDEKGEFTSGNWIIK